MHGTKGEVQVEIQMRPLQLSLNGDSSLKNLGASQTNGVISSKGQENGWSIGDDELSDDDQVSQVPLKKNRLLESNLSTSILRSSSPITRTTGTTSSTNGNGVHKDVTSCGDQDQNGNADADDDQDDDGSGAMKEGISNCMTSGENSDAEVDAEDELNGSDVKHDESRKLFECDVCNMKFSNGANMRRHRMRHSGIKPYECKICKKRFFRKDHLAEHMATHSKLLPFRCPICNKGFQRSIACRAHFNEHVGGSHEVVKTCPLCSYKAGSLKSMRAHFLCIHKIDLDNPIPHSPLPTMTSNGGGGGSTSNDSGEYSELVHALGFDDSREKSNSESLIPSHFLVPQIEISSNSSFMSHLPFTAETYYNFVQEERQSGNGGGSSPNVSPKSDRSSNAASSLELLIKKEITDDQHLSSPEQQPLRIVEDPTELLNATKSQDNNSLDIQDSPEDLSSGNSSCYLSGTGKSNIRRTRTLNDGKVKWKHFLTKRSSHNNNNSHNGTKSNSFSIMKLSPLKSLLRDDSSSSSSLVNTNDKSQINTLRSSQNDSIANDILSNNFHSTKSSLANGIVKNNSGHSSSAQSQSCDGDSASATSTNSNASTSGTTTGSTESVSSATTTSHSRPNRRGGSSTSIPNLIHQCVHCGIIFPNKTLYFLHKGCHSDSNPWRCNICGEFCYNVYDFNSHLLSKSHQ